MDNALELVHPHEDMVRAALNPHVLQRGQVPCLGCMSEQEKAQVVDQLLENPETRIRTLRKMNELSPGNPHVELALAYETNKEFQEWLNAYTWEATQNSPREN